MADVQQLDLTYHVIMEAFVARGQAPHFPEMAKAFSIAPEQGKRLLHELMNTGLPLPIWLFPDTDPIASFSPFSNPPTPYRLSVDGQQQWFAQ